MFDPTTLVGFHTWLSLIALAAGFVVVADLLGGRRRSAWTLVFLVTAILTSVTGFLFPYTGFLPSHGVGVLSLIALAAAVAALYAFGLAGAWRRIYVVGIVVAEYFLAFVAIAQAFLKVPSLNALAPTQSEPPFAIAQGVLLVVFVVLGVMAVRRA